MKLREMKADVVPGIYECPAADYHADPCPEPSLSSSIAKLLTMETPRKAFLTHPRLNPQAVEEEAEKFDLGTAAHALLLEGEASVQIIDAPDWRTKAAKEARDAARAAGKTPLLSKVWVDVQRMVERTIEQIEAQEDDGCRMFLGDGKSERVVVWQESGVWCRARIDWLRSDGIDDFKSTATTANPEAWTRTMFNLGFDLQAEFYRRGVKAVTGKDLVFRFAVQENYPPFDLSVISLGPDASLLAQKKCDYAIEKWKECLATKQWAGYPTQTCYASLPAWHETMWLQKETNGKAFE